MGISDNEIARLPPEIGNLTNLEEFDISRNGKTLDFVLQMWIYCAFMMVGDCSVLLWSRPTRISPAYLFISYEYAFKLYLMYVFLSFRHMRYSGKYKVLQIPG